MLCSDQDIPIDSGLLLVPITLGACSGLGGDCVQVRLYSEYLPFVLLGCPAPLGARVPYSFLPSAADDGPNRLATWPLLSLSAPGYRSRFLSLSLSPAIAHTRTRGVEGGGGGVGHVSIVGFVVCVEKAGFQMLFTMSWDSGATVSSYVRPQHKKHA